MAGETITPEGGVVAYNAASRLWPHANEGFFRDRKLRAVRQDGPRCVSTVLGILTGEPPKRFQVPEVNTQDPVSWSEALHGWGMKLAYCPTDVRRVGHYIEELVRLDDLFTLSYYTTLDPAVILGEPDRHGWVTGSHIVVLHRGSILDPASGSQGDAREHPCIDYHTKRIFRVVPHDHARGL